MDGDAVAALGLAVAFVLDGVFDCDFCAEGEGEEDGEDGEDGEAHGCGCCWGQLRWWCLFGDMWIDQEDWKGAIEGFADSVDGLFQFVFEDSRTDLVRV